VSIPLFLLMAALTVASALTVIVHPSPIYSALGLVSTLFMLAVLFLGLDAQMVAVLQIIVYAGAIVVLFLFVIMFLGVDRREAAGPEATKFQKPLALILGVVALIEILILSGVTKWVSGQHSTAGALDGPGENVQKLGQSIYTRYLLPFEMTAALLVIAVVSAVVLSRRQQPSASELSSAEQEHLDSTEREPQ
jgi:NADH-quinone oxidoreductase subunit J